MIVVSAAIIQHNSKFLITRRAANKHLAGYWEFPGGKVEEMETPEQCLKREIKEELGVEVIVGRFFMENIHQYDDKKILLKAYLCDHLSGDIILKDHDKALWINIHEFDNFKFAPADIPIIKHLQLQC